MNARRSISRSSPAFVTGAKLASASRPSLSEEFLEPLQHDRHGLRREATQTPHEAFRIDGPELIQSDKAGATLKATRYAPRIYPSARRHRRDDDGPQMLVEFVGGHHEARTRFLDLAAGRGTETNQKDIATGPGRPRYRHSHPPSSNRVGVGSSSMSSWRAADMARAASAQPLRGRRVAWTTSRPGSACSSTSSGNCA
jgi:hypothetical protein